MSERVGSIKVCLYVILSSLPPLIHLAMKCSNIKTFAPELFLSILYPSQKKTRSEKEEAKNTQQKAAEMYSESCNNTIRVYKQGERKLN